MLPRSLLPAVFAVGMLFGVPDVSSTWRPGVGSTATAKGFYTRKRVKGRWVTGRFASATRHATRRGAARHRLAQRERPGERRAPRGQAALAQAPVAAQPLPLPLPPAQSQTRPSPNSAVLTTASLGPAMSDEAGRERMRMPLEARARLLAAGTPRGSGASPATDVPHGEGSPHVAAPPIVVPPRTVTFDLEKGSRTIVYGDDIVISEPFDVARLKELVGPPASAR